MSQMVESHCGFIRPVPVCVSPITPVSVPFHVSGPERLVSVPEYCEAMQNELSTAKHRSMRRPEYLLMRLCASENEVISVRLRGLIRRNGEDFPSVSPKIVLLLWGKVELLPRIVDGGQPVGGCLRAVGAIF